MGSLWPRSGTIERYADDIRAAGAKAFFFQGGTTSPTTVFGDSGESQALPNPVLADARGRWPDIFIPYSATGYDVQVKTADNVQLTYTVSIPNPNPIAVTPPPATDGLQTGMVHAEFVNATKTGFVRLNGRTMGNASSSATERANADTSNLFTYLWNNLADAVAPVSSGRGSSAAADFAANKTLQLVDMRGSVLTGLDDMGNSAASLFSAQSFIAGHSAIISGSACGSNTRTLSIGNMPAHTHPASADSQGTHSHGGTIITGIQSANHTHSGTTDGHTHFGTTNLGGAHSHTVNACAQVVSNGAPGGSTNGAPLATVITTSTHTGHTHGFDTEDSTDTFTSGIQSASHTHIVTVPSDGAHTHTITLTSVGSGTAVDNMGNSRLVTWFIKL